MNLARFFKIGFHNTLKIWNSRSFKSSTVYVYQNTVVDSWHIGEFSSARYNIVVEHGKNDIENVSVDVVARVNQASLTVYGRNNFGKDLIRFTATVDSGKVTLIANPYYENDEITPLSGIKLIYEVSYSERIAPAEIPTISGESSSLGGQLGVYRNYNNTNLPDGFLNVNSTGSIEVSNIKTVQVPSQSDLEADYFMASLNLRNSDNSVDIITDNTTKTLSLILAATPYLNVTNSISITAIGNSFINNINIGQTTPKSGKFTVLSIANVTTFTGPNITISLQPSGSGTLSLTSTATSSIDKMNIGLSIPSTGNFTQILINGPTPAENQLVTKFQLTPIQLLGAI